jgi:hypothetical protein
MRGKFHGGGELSRKCVQLPARVGAHRGELRGIVTGVWRPQPLGEFAEFAEAFGMRVAFDAPPIARLTNHNARGDARAAAKR